jgi:mono/diheme cytochrome c family protein
MTKLRFALYALAAVIVVSLGAAEGRKTSVAKATAEAKAARAAKIKRGEYLVTIGGCNDCHTPFKMGPNGPEPDMSRMLSGHPESLAMPPAPALEGPWVWTAAGTNTAFAGPWGVSFTRNLTPDKLTGTGIWTEEMFIKTIRTGRHWGVSRPILPPMPWFNYAKMTDDDLKAVWAYLQSIPPVKNQVPDAILAPPPQQVAAK